MICAEDRKCEHGLQHDDYCEGCETEQLKGDSDLNALLCAGHAKVKNGVVFNINEKLWRAEEFEACMMAMDAAGVPRFNEQDIVYSLWGRACWMARNLQDA
jgi:uncharacterized membrane protein